VLRALHHFGTPLQNLTWEDLLTDDTVFQLGAAQRVDTVTAASGLGFEEAFRRSMAVDIDGIEGHVASLSASSSNKRASRRTKDLADAEALEEIRDSEQDNAS